MAGRRCPRSDTVDGRTRACPAILTDGERYCPRHRREYEQRRGSRQARGYDATHDRTRAAWQSRMDSGERVYCATCGVLLNGEPWDLGHTDGRRSYRGPQCMPCNRSDGGRRGRAMQS